VLYEEDKKDRKDRKDRKGKIGKIGKKYGATHAPCSGTCVQFFPTVLFVFTVALDKTI